MYPDRQGSNNSHWRDGKKYNHGYIYVWCPSNPSSNKDGYIYEHRLVMEKALKRHLKPKERVHHKNHIKTDNRIENLELSANQRDHIMKHHPNNIKEAYKKGRYYNLHGKWSYKYTACIKCGTIKIKHNCRGLCQKCWSNWYYHNYKKYSIHLSETKSQE